MRKIDRFDKYLSLKGLNDNKATIQLGLSVGVLGKSRKEGRDLSDRVIEQILNFYTDINRIWLLTGEGEMLKAESTESNKSDSSIYPYVDRVPLVPLNALGGSLVGFSEDSVRSSDCEIVRSPVDNAEFAIPVLGDSMDPVYPSGCRVFVKKIDMSAFIIWGNTYVLDTVNGIILKEVQPSKKEGCIICHSKNPSGQYKDFEVNLKDVRGMYRVMACLIAM